MATDEAKVAAQPGGNAFDAGLLLAAEIQSDRPRVRRFGYRVGGVGFLVPNGTASEVIHQARLHPLPWHVPYMRGMVNVRGNVAPVFDLGPLFTPGTAPVETPYTLIVDSGYRAVGVLTETLPVTLSCEPDDDAAAPEVPAALVPFTRGSARANRQRWYELDLLSCLRAIVTAGPAGN